MKSKNGDNRPKIGQALVKSKHIVGFVREFTEMV